MQTIFESLKRQREQILGDSSEELLSRHTSLLEIAIISLYNRAANRAEMNTEQFRGGGAVLAMADFARGLVGPGSAIPILFLEGEPSAWKERRMEEIVLPLKEAGWLPVVERDTAEGLMRRASEDLTFLMQLLDVHYISGNRTLLEMLDQGIDGLIESRQGELLDRLNELMKGRRSLLDDPGNWLEPDLMLNPGGLADISAIRAALRIAAGIRGLEDAIFKGYLIRQEVDFLLRAEKTFARLLSLLGNISGNLECRLGFDDQERLADRLGYAGSHGFLPVEAFMQEVCQLFHGVTDISREFWERLQESRVLGTAGGFFCTEVLEEGLTSYAGKIRVQTDRYPATPGHLVHLFSLAAQSRLGLDNVTRQWVHHHRHVLNTAAGDLQVKRELLELIRSDEPDLPVFRRFCDKGLLASLIPETASVHGLVQHDAFHAYPVQEHHLRTLSVLKRLVNGHLVAEESELTRVAQSIGDPIWLYLAGLLHDIGKVSGRNHAVHGGEVIPSIARRLSLSPNESDLIQFLVAQHLLLIDSASMRDLADEEMLANCALIIGNVERLDHLLLLSYADMASTGPRAMQKWRDTPVLQLFERIREILERGEPSPQVIAERIHHIRIQIEKELSDLMDKAELDLHFAGLVPRYLLSMTPGAVARHIRMERQLRLSGEPFTLEVSVSDRAAEITILSDERPGLLARVAGICTLHDMNIVSAQVFSMKDDLLLLIFQCRLPEKLAGDLEWEAVKRDIRKLLDGRIALDFRIAAHAIGRHFPEPPRHTPSTIRIDNDSSELYTILEVYTADRVGLLYTITRTLYDLQIRIAVAKITTKVDQAADVFYIRTYTGGKVTDPEQIREIRNALCFWLDGPERNCPEGSD